MAAATEDGDDKSYDDLPGTDVLNDGSVFMEFRDERSMVACGSATADVLLLLLPVTANKTVRITRDGTE